MDDASPNAFYKGVKKVIKWTFIVIAALLILAAAWIGITLASDHFSSKSEEDRILAKAIPFASSHTPWVYTRNDFGDESKLHLWLLGDTDQHAIIKVDGNYSVYSTTTDRNGNISFNHIAGKICTYASAFLLGKGVISVECENKSYLGGAWNKFE